MAQPASTTVGRGNLGDRFRGRTGPALRAVRLESSQSETVSAGVLSVRLSSGAHASGFLLRIHCTGAAAGETRALLHSGTWTYLHHSLFVVRAEEVLLLRRSSSLLLRPAGTSM